MKACSTCCFWRQKEIANRSEIFGTCHFRAPLGQLVPFDTPNTTKWQFPLVEADDFCYQHTENLGTLIEELEARQAYAESLQKSDAAKDPTFRFFEAGKVEAFKEAIAILKEAGE